MSVNAGFLHELERCARAVYELRDDATRQQSRRHIDRIFDHDRRVVIGLTSQLLAAIALAPWLGPGMVVAGLAVLYVGVLASTTWTLRRLRRADTSKRAESIDLAVRRAVSSCPPLTASGLAVLIQLANLAAISPTTRSMAMLRDTLREAKAHPSLQAWPFLDDVAALVDGSLGKALVKPVRS